MSVHSVLFDWHGTLAHDPDVATWLTRAAARIGRNLADVDLASIERRLNETYELPHLAVRFPTADVSAEAHRAVMIDWFHEAGLDSDFAEALYTLDLDPAFQQFYPDVEPTLAALRAAGVGIAVVSDIHFDLRPLFAMHDLDVYVDTYVLSFEHGIQKPDPAVFRLALDALGVDATGALMVGDNPRRDGGAASAGIRTLLVPPMPTFGARGLDAVLQLAGVAPT